MRRPLTAVAWINVALHVAGLGLAAVGLRPGSPLEALAERRDYLAGAPALWTLNWLVWMACAAGLLTFLTLVRRRLPADSALASLALTVAAVGAVLDFCCDAIFIVIFPQLAAHPEPLFLLAERTTNLVSLTIANGAYSVAILMFVAELAHRPGVTRVTTVVGTAVGVGGLLLAGAGVSGVPWHAAVVPLPMIGLFCVWVVLVARALEPTAEGSRGADL